MARDLVDDHVHGAGDAGFRIRQRQFARTATAPDRAAPCPEILRAEIAAAGGLADIVVDVLRAHRTPFAAAVDVLEEMLTRQFLDAADDLRHAPVDELQLPFLAGLALEGEAQLRSFDLDMPSLQRRQPEAFVVARINRIADADHRVVEQPDDGGDDALAWQFAPAQVGVDPLADIRQRAGEVGKVRILHLVAALRPARVVAVLLAAPLVAARRLDVAIRVAAYPHIGPGGRNDQRLDARQRLFVDDRLSVRAGERKSCAGSSAPDARLRVADVGQ